MVKSLFDELCTWTAGDRGENYEIGTPKLGDMSLLQISFCPELLALMFWSEMRISSGIVDLFLRNDLIVHCRLLLELRSQSDHIFFSNSLNKDCLLSTLIKNHSRILSYVDTIVNSSKMDTKLLWNEINFSFMIFILHSFEIFFVLSKRLKFIEGKSL